MSFELRGEAVIAAMDLDELKLVYRALHSGLADHVELMDTDFLIELQAFLQQQAKKDNVDVSDHAAWDAWLGNPATSCSTRVRRRREIDKPGR